MKLAVRPAHPHQNEHQANWEPFRVMLGRVWYGLRVSHISLISGDSCRMSDSCVKVNLARNVGGYNTYITADG